MAIVEVFGGPITRRYLDRKSKHDLATMVLEYAEVVGRLQDENERLRAALTDIADMRLMFEGGMGVSKANLENTLSEARTLARAALDAAQGGE